jgi:hypothetical protein
MRRYIVVLFALLIAACGVPATDAPPTAAPAAPAAANAGPCSEGTLQAYRNAYNGIIDRWGDVAIKAGQTEPAELQPQIDAMQKISDELAALTPPSCAQPAQAESLEAMQLAIGGYRTRLAQKDVGTAIRDSIDQLSDARSRVAALPGTPEPTPTAAPTSTPLPTFTPLPTATPTSTPVPTATPEPHQGVISSKQAQVFENATSTQPVKTLMRDTPVLVFEVVKGRVHIRAADVDGWVAQSSVIVK